MKRLTQIGISVIGMALLLTAGSGFPAMAGDGDWCNQGWNNEDHYCEVQVFEFDAPGGKLDIEPSSNGGVRVEGWNEDYVQVHTRISVYGMSQSDAKELAQRIKTELINGRLRVDGPDSGSNWNSKKNHYSASFRVMIPERSDISVSTTNGGITLENLDGEIRFEATNGGVTLEDLAGDVKGRTTNGGMTVKLSGSSWDGESMDVGTTNGGLTVYVPKGYNADFVTGTRWGRFDSDLELTMTKTKGLIETTLGSGGPMVKATTKNGSVRIRQR